MVTNTLTICTHVFVMTSLYYTIPPAYVRQRHFLTQVCVLSWYQWIKLFRHLVWEWNSLLLIWILFTITHEIQSAGVNKNVTNYNWRLSSCVIRVYNKETKTLTDKNMINGNTRLRPRNFNFWLKEQWPNFQENISETIVQKFSQNKKN